MKKTKLLLITFTLLFAVGCTSTCDQFCDRIIFCQNISDNACYDLCEKTNTALNDEMDGKIVDCLEEDVTCEMLRTEESVIEQAEMCYKKVSE